MSRTIVVVASCLLLLSACASARARDPAAEEAKLCDGVPSELRDRGLLAERAFVQDVVDLREHVGKQALRVLRGAGVVVRPGPGMTRPWLGRICACHIAHVARAANLARTDDPLAVDGASFDVLETDTAYVVEIRSQRIDDAREIARRAHLLAADEADERSRGGRQREGAVEVECSSNQKARDASYGPERDWPELASLF